MKIFKTIICFVVLLSPHCFCETQKYEPQEGDLLFQESKSLQSQAIRIATNSDYSHVGLLFFVNKKPHVMEAVGPVKYTPISKWIGNGVGEKYEVKRLKEGLNAGQIESLRKAANAFEGFPYDKIFEWTDKKIYCSELVWKAYEKGLGIELSDTRKLSSFDLSDPIVDAIIKERFHSKSIHDEDVVAPSDLHKSEKLFLVHKN